ncbi:amidohydrolase family protein [soil metagenome]
MTSTLLSNARLYGTDALVDLLVVDGVISSLDEGALEKLDDRVDLEGRFVGPGLWDAHVHVGQWALRSNRVDVSSAASAAETVALVRAAIAASPPAPGTVFVGQGFRDGLWPDSPSAQLLEVGGVPVSLVSGDVHTVWTNSAALRSLGRPESDWWLREQPAFDLNVQLSSVPPAQLDTWVLAAATAAASRGVVGISDFEFDDAAGAWGRRFAAGFRGLRVRALVYPPHLDAAAAADIHTDQAIDGTGGLLTGGPFKLFTDGSLNTRTAWCDDPYPGSTSHGLPTYGDGELLDLAREGIRLGIVPTIHAIGDHAVTVALDTFEALGSGGSIQHVQLAHPDDLPRFARLGVRASVQPEHAMDDRDVADHFWRGRTDRAFAYRSLLEAGTELELGSDAPVAPLDPWVAIAAAVTRSRDGLPPWHPEQALPVEAALRASWGRVGGLAAGGAADLVITEADPLSAPQDSLRTMPVWGTMLAGEWTHRA